ncbi:glyoxalase [Trinickia dabaoshanensis]|uniref:Glyoxalase n=1 Tax=Trinickia dabaoshanensis TaxID=564714 RepID=A0A2N7W171_9BURK|nr:VOC family protein [Trinickia dabaoshanensis]PMS23164.1 glyoxalase [Trinickia dabaoshanensis]
MTATATANRTLSWFEIPAINFERAVRFYEAALDQPMRRELFGGVPMAVFASDEDATGGAIIHNPRELRPSVTGDGVTIYLTAEPTLQATLDRVTPAGGKIDGSIVELPNDIGYIAFFIDPEGNRIGLHSRHLR